MERYIIITFLVLVAIVGIVSADVVCPGCDQFSGVGWFDNMSTESNLTYYGGNNDTVLANKTTKTFTSSNQADIIFYLNNRNMGNGSYLVNNKEPTDGKDWSPLIWALNKDCSVGVYYCSGASAYLIRQNNVDPYFSVGKVVLGADSVLDYIVDGSISPKNVLMNYTVNWTTYGSNNIKVYRNSSLMFTVSDTSVSNAGRVGFDTKSNAPSNLQISNLTVNYKPVPIANFTVDKTTCSGLCTVSITDDSATTMLNILTNRSRFVDYRNVTVNGTAGGMNAPQSSGPTTNNPVSIVLSPPAAGSITYTIGLNITNTTAGGTWVNRNITTVTQNVVVSAAGGTTTPSAQFSCTPQAGVRNSTRTCNNESAGALIPDTVDWYGSGTNPCIGTNTTSMNPNIFPMNFSWCGLCLIAKTNEYNTSCQQLYVSQPWAGY